MILAITGAAGFLGSAVVNAASNSGHNVIAISRSKNPDPNTTARAPNVEHRYADLQNPDDLRGILDGADALIHLAAAKKGTFHDQYPSTVAATRHVLAEATQTAIRRTVLVSSFAVYDYAAIPSGTTIDERSPVDRSGEGRDAYTQTKVLQEEVAQEWAAAVNADLVIARPGVVYGPDSWWTYRLGEQFGRLRLYLGSDSHVPLTYRDNCASALIHLATAEQLEHNLFNILDQDPPTQRWYRSEVSRRSPAPRSRAVVVPWRIASIFVQTVARLNSRRSTPFRLPGFLVPESLAVRAKPFQYSDSRLRGTGWRQPLSLKETLSRTFTHAGDGSSSS